MTEQELGLLPQGLWRLESPGGLDVGMTVFYEKCQVCKVTSGDCVFQSPAQLPASTIIIMELSYIEIEEGTGVCVLKFSTLWLKHCPLAIAF